MLSLPFTVRFHPPAKKNSSSSVRIKSLITRGRIDLDQDFLVLDTMNSEGSQSALLVDNEGNLMWVPFSLLKFTGLYTGEDIRVGEQILSRYDVDDAASIQGATVAQPRPKSSSKKAPEGAKVTRKDDEHPSLES